MVKKLLTKKEQQQKSVAALARLSKANAVVLSAHFESFAKATKQTKYGTKCLVFAIPLIINQEPSNKDIDYLLLAQQYAWRHFSMPNMSFIPCCWRLFYQNPSWKGHNIRLQSLPEHHLSEHHLKSVQGMNILHALSVLTAHSVRLLAPPIHQQFLTPHSLLFLGNMLQIRESPKIHQR